MTFDEHYIQIGRLVGNLQSLELVLRLFLYEEMAENGQLPQPGDATVPKSWLTNYKSLGHAVDAYNAALSNVEAPTFAVDKTVVAVRDAIAHGRILSQTPSPPLTLYKFGKPKNGDVPVESVDKLTTAWLRAKIHLTYEEAIKVTERAKARGHKWPG